MIEAPLALAFTAGVVATVNPCGFAMLPAYLSYFVGLEDDTVTRGSAASTSRALVVGGVGVSYAVASLSCTLPIFLTVVAGTIPQTDLVSGVATFLVYGLGMSLVLLAVTVALALGKRSIVGWLRRSSRHVNRVAGAILVAAGGYIVYFWATNLGRGPVRASDPVVFVESLSSRVTRLIGDAPIVSGAVLGAIVLVAVAFVLAAHRRREHPKG